MFTTANRTVVGPVRAFTLVELIIVLVVIGTLASITVPRFAGAASNHRAAAAARRIERDLDLAQQLARSSHTRHLLEFDPKHSSYVIYEWNPGAAGPGHEWLAVRGMTTSDRPYRVSLPDEPYRSSVLYVDFGGDTGVIFDGFGVADSGGTVVVASGSVQETVVFGDAAVDPVN